MSTFGHYHGGRFCDGPCQTFDIPRAADLPDGTVVANGARVLRYGYDGAGG